jgi:hypothetical protein
MKIVNLILVAPTPTPKEENQPALCIFDAFQDVGMGHVYRTKVLFPSALFRLLSTL